VSTDRRTIAYWRNLDTQNRKEMEYYKRELKHYKDRIEHLNSALNDLRYLDDLRTKKAVFSNPNLLVSYRSTELIECQKKQVQKEIAKEKEFFDCVFVRLNPNEM
jgi:hypothetical protein